LDRLYRAMYPRSRLRVFVGCYVSNIHRRPYGHNVFLYFYFFQRSVHRPKRRYDVTPTRSVQVARPPKYPPHRDLGLLVGCCIVCSNGGHLKAETPPLSLFFEGLRFGTPNKNPTMVRAQPTPRALYGPIGSSGAKIWDHGGCCHGERGPKPLKGRAAADHVGCCVFCVL
jgi:hypothetical protein